MRVHSFVSVLNRQTQQLFSNAEADLVAHSVTQRQVNRHQPERSKSAQNTLLINQNDLHAIPGGRQRSRDSCYASSGDQYIAVLCNAQRLFLFRNPFHKKQPRFLCLTD